MEKTRKTILKLLLIVVVIFGACTHDSPKVEQSPPALTTSRETFIPENVRGVFKRSCESCHGLDGHGITGVAPDLRQSAQRGADEWVKYFSDPQSRHPGAQMPSTIWRSQDEIKAVSAFLGKDTVQPAEAESAR